MNFLVLGYDGTDVDAPQRRIAARPAHLALFKDMLERGVFLYGAAILTEEGQMAGSMIVCDFSSRAKLEAQWLTKEPYVLGDVWRSVEVYLAQVPPFVLDRFPPSRP